MQNGYVESFSGRRTPGRHAAPQPRPSPRDHRGLVDDYNTKRPAFVARYAIWADARSLAPVSGPRGMKGGRHLMPRLASAEWHHSLPEAAQD